LLRRLFPSVSFVLAVVATIAVARSAGPAKLTIAIIGDSTVCDYPADHACRGWGQFIGEHFKDGVRVVNLAASGRSTKSFIAEGRWKRTLAEKPDVVLIQFGHNDSHAATRPEATDAATDYRDFLRRYVDETRAANATPVLVTPMYRRTFDADGKLTDILQPYAAAMKAVAAERKVALIDLHTSSGELFRHLGKERCPDLANSPTDFTHFNEKGARAMADIVMKELPAAVPQLADWLRPEAAKPK
jgi:lysophospholipase L1-like esterase